MFCPKCGKGEQSPDAYCRSCGVWLHDAEKLAKRGYSRQSPEQNLQMMLIFNILSAAFALTIMILLIVAIKNGVSFTPVKVAMGFSIAILAWQIVTGITTFSMYRDMKRRRMGQFRTKEFNPYHVSDTLPAADTTQFAAPVPSSITERTTSKLTPVPNRQNQ